jgi:hypothetical protein
MHSFTPDIHCMSDLINLQDRILNAGKEDFHNLALEVFDYQSRNNKVYAEYLQLLNKQHIKPRTIEEIPFLPTQVFKSRIVKAGDWTPERIFESSGTTSDHKSLHYIKSIDWYHQVAKQCFEFHYGDLHNYEFIGLLPSAKEAPNSSLVNMFMGFAGIAGSYIPGVSYLHSFQQLNKELRRLNDTNHQVILLGLSFALVDYVKKFETDFPNGIVIETGGMKNQHRQLEKNQILEALKKGFPKAKIHSEYGMTELLSQAYAMDGIHYTTSNTMNILISDPTDPFQFLEPNTRGIINIIDLGNLFTCSFLQTGDLGMLDSDGCFQVFGRYQAEDMRGCVQWFE